MSLHAEEPSFLPVAGAFVINYLHDGLNRGVRQIDTNKQHPARAREFAFRNARPHEREQHAEGTDGFAVSTRGLGIRGLAAPRGAFNQRDRSWKVGMNTRAAAAIVALFCLPLGCRGGPLKLTLWIEAFEDEPAIVAEQLLHTHRAEKHAGIVKILLNPLALAPWALHH